MCAVALLAAALAFAAVLASTARAGTIHTYSGQFGSFGPAAGQFNGPVALATDETGDVYVGDAGNNRISIFTAGGEAAGQILLPGGFTGLGGVDADHGADRVYVSEQWAATPAVHVFKTDGTPLGTLDATATPAGSFGAPGAIAVDDSTGDVYVVNSGTGVVDVFGDDGSYKATFGQTGDAQALVSPTGIAVDGSSNVYVLDAGPSFSGRVQQFTALGAAYVRDLAVESPMAVAADTANDHVLVGQSAPAVQVVALDASGAALETFGSGRLGWIAGLAVAPTSHRVYALDPYAPAVVRFDTTTAPDLATGAASGVTADSATIEGTVNPQGYSGITAYFEYGLDASYGNGQTGGQDPGNGMADAPVSTQLTGLEPHQTYHYRIAASTPFGTQVGDDATFTTDPVAPVVGGQASYATSITTSGADLHATVNPNNSPTTYRFEYGTTTAYGTNVAGAAPATGFGDQDVSVALSGLDPGTTYHFRVVADNGTGGEVPGADATFTTASATPPTATDVTGVSAVLNGVAAAGSAPRQFHFEYGTTTAYGQSTADGYGGPGPAAKAVSTVLSDLAPGTTYHFRLVSTAGSSTTYSTDATFTTSPAPSAETAEPTDITSSGAALHGTVDTHGLPGTYRFVVEGVGNPVSRSTPEQPVTGDGPVAVSSAIGELPDNTSYTVRIVATVAGAEDRGDAVAFSTPRALEIPPGTVPPMGNPYGCVAPHLNDPALPAAAGQAYTLTGSDLGVGGRVTVAGLGQARTTAWTAGAITIEVPDGVTGALSVSIDCGKGSNAVTLTVPKPPSNAFSIVSVKVNKNSSRAVVTVKVPGAGKLLVGGTYVRSASRAASKAGTYKLTVKLNAKGAKRLRKARSRKLSAGLAVRFTPTGGTAATKNATAKFTRAKPKAKKKG